METQWPLIFFTLLTTFSAGVIGLLGLYVVLGKAQKSAFVAAIVALAALAIGGIASFTHLHHWDRLFNGFGSITSGITQELIGIVVLFVVSVMILVMSRRGKLPQWLGVVALVVGVAMVFVTANSYYMSARPLWATPLLFVFYYAGAIASGAAAMWLISALTKAEDDEQTLGARSTAIGGVLFVIALVAYGAFSGTVQFPSVGYYFDPTRPTNDMLYTDVQGLNLFVGPLAAYFWAALLCGGVLVAGVGLAKWKSPKGSLAFASLALLGVFAGGVIYRVVLYLVGYSIFIFY